jgi:hypothetical protein
MTWFDNPWRWLLNSPGTRAAFSDLSLQVYGSALKLVFHPEIPGSHFGLKNRPGGVKRERYQQCLGIQAVKNFGHLSLGALTVTGRIVSTAVRDALA